MNLNMKLKSFSSWRSIVSVLKEKHKKAPNGNNRKLPHFTFNLQRQSMTVQNERHMCHFLNVLSQVHTMNPSLAAECTFTRIKLKKSLFKRWTIKLIRDQN